MEKKLRTRKIHRKLYKALLSSMILGVAENSNVMLDSKGSIVILNYSSEQATKKSKRQLKKNKVVD